MPANIDPETLYVDDLPGIWSPVQWELTEEERQQELDQQATASMLWSSDAPEAILRLLLSEADIERIFDSPPGYDPNEQGEWNPELVTYAFKRPIRLVKIVRQPDYLYIEYNFEDLGYWGFEIEPEKVSIQRL